MHADDAEPRGIRVTEPDFDAPVTMHVVLVYPEIPQNTGNIARLCAGMGAWLHLVEPLGFRLEDRYLKRAGLDYWPRVKLSVHRDLARLEAILPADRVRVFAAGASTLLWDAPLERRDVLIFGAESVGLPRDLLARWSASTVRIPATDAIRSHNVANSVAIAGYTLLGRQRWPGAAVGTELS
jgi:tRNA (cytidine/uridine-2'-O-)-methyltransferase